MTPKAPTIRSLPIAVPAHAKSILTPSMLLTKLSSPPFLKFVLLIVIPLVFSPPFQLQDQACSVALEPETANTARKPAYINFTNLPDAYNFFKNLSHKFPTSPNNLGILVTSDQFKLTVFRPKQAPTTHSVTAFILGPAPLFARDRPSFTLDALKDGLAKNYVMQIHFPTASAPIYFNFTDEIQLSKFKARVIELSKGFQREGEPLVSIGTQYLQVFVNAPPQPSTNQSIPQVAAEAKGQMQCAPMAKITKPVTPPPILNPASALAVLNPIAAVKPVVATKPVAVTKTVTPPPVIKPVIIDDDEAIPVTKAVTPVIQAISHVEPHPGLKQASSLTVLNPIADAAAPPVIKPVKPITMQASASVTPPPVIRPIITSDNKMPVIQPITNLGAISAITASGGPVAVLQPITKTPAQPSTSSTKEATQSSSQGQKAQHKNLKKLDDPNISWFCKAVLVNDSDVFAGQLCAVSNVLSSAFKKVAILSTKTNTILLVFETEVAAKAFYQTAKSNFPSNPNAMPIVVIEGQQLQLSPPQSKALWLSLDWSISFSVHPPAKPAFTEAELKSELPPGLPSFDLSMAKTAKSDSILYFKDAVNAKTFYAELKKTLPVATKSKKPCTKIKAQQISFSEPICPTTISLDLGNYPDGVHIGLHDSVTVALDYDDNQFMVESSRQDLTIRSVPESQESDGSSNYAIDKQLQFLKSHLRQKLYQLCDAYKCIAAFLSIGPFTKLHLIGFVSAIEGLVSPINQLISTIVTEDVSLSSAFANEHVNILKSRFPEASIEFATGSKKLKITCQRNDIAQVKQFISVAKPRSSAIPMSSHEIAALSASIKDMQETRSTDARVVVTASTIFIFGFDDAVLKELADILTPKSLPSPSTSFNARVDKEVFKMLVRSQASWSHFASILAKDGAVAVRPEISGRDNMIKIENASKLSSNAMKNASAAVLALDTEHVVPITAGGMGVFYTAAFQDALQGQFIANLYSELHIKSSTSSIGASSTVDAYYVVVHCVASEFQSIKSALMQKVSQLTSSKTLTFPSVSAVDEELEQSLQCCAADALVDIQWKLSGAVCTVTLSGDEGRVIDTCRLVTELFQHRDADDDDDIVYPINWTPLADESIPFASVAPGSEEWNMLQMRLSQSLPTASLRHVDRIQNRISWERFAKSEIKLQRRLRRDVDKPLLFLGTAPRDPGYVIYSKTGIELTDFTNGKWGS